MFLGGFTGLKPCIFRFMISDFCPNASKVGFTQISVLKNADTYTVTSLTVTWIILSLFVVPNLFLCANDVNDETSVVFYSCGIPSSHFFSTPVCLSNVQHIS